MAKAKLVAIERIERAIVVLRGHRVMLDADLSVRRVARPERPKPDVKCLPQP